MRRVVGTDGGQAGFGFAPVMGEARPASKVVKLARCGLFYMIEHGAGWRPFAPSYVEGAEVRRRVEGHFPASVVRVVDESEVGR